MEDLDARIAEANEEFISEEPESAPAPTDLYQARQDVQRDYVKKQFPKGSSARVKATIKDVVEGAGAGSLARAYERARDDSESLKEAGENRRAQLVINQYMEEKFLPAVEVVVNFTSPDEVLNSVEGLRLLDNYALGAGSMSGYTAAYVREAYEDLLGKVEALSDPTVSHTIRRINGLLDTDQIRIARGLAQKMKRHITNGDNIASDQDFEFISRVAAGA